MASRRRQPAVAPLDRVREIISAWPETDERISHGAPTWWGGRKTFASFHDNHHGDDRIALWIKSDPDTQESLVEADPSLFFVPPYVGPSGWLGVIVDGPPALRRRVDWDVVSGLLEAGYRSVAPKRALAKLAEDR